MRMASMSCLAFERQDAWRAFSRAAAKTGKRIAARMAIIAITTSSSTRVKPAVAPRVEPQRIECLRYIDGGPPVLLEATAASPEAMYLRLKKNATLPTLFI